MNKSQVFLTAAPVMLAATLLPALAAQAQGARRGAATATAKPAEPAKVSAEVSKPSSAERSLVGISLGRNFLEVVRRFGPPQEVQTVALESSPDQLPGVGGAGGEGATPGGYPGAGGTAGGYPGGYPGAGGTAGGYPGARPGGYPGGYPGAGGGSSGGPFGGGVPTLPPAGGGGGVGLAGGPMADGPGGGLAGGPGGAMGGGQGVGQGQPEFSNALLYIYKRPGNVRLEFLVNEDGRIAQISVAAPTNKGKNVSFPGAKTSRGITLGSGFADVSLAYGYPERNRMLPGYRFYEAYYTKKNHCAFTFDQQTMKVARITIALAD